MSENALSANPERENVIVFANCAGGARKEAPNPYALGAEIRKHPALAGKHLIAVAVSEAMLSYTPNQAVQLAKIGPMYEPVSIEPGHQPALGGSFLKDHHDLMTGLGGVWHKYYLSNLNSEDHHNVYAINAKWRGPEAVPRLRQQFEAHGDRLVVHHGVGLLLEREPIKPPGLLGVLLRPSGMDPDNNPANDPLQFLGNRDTEPRTMVMARTTICGEEVDLAFCQLETHTSDNRGWEPGQGDRPLGSLHREAQVKIIREHFDLMKSQRVILLGDFNARPGWPELCALCEGKHGFRHAEPKNWPEGRPYTHLTYKILIDHAFLKGFDETWSFQLEVLRLSQIDKGRITDHCPIALTVARR